MSLYLVSFNIKNNNSEKYGTLDINAKNKKVSEELAEQYLQKNFKNYIITIISVIIIKISSTRKNKIINFNIND